MILQNFYRGYGNLNMPEQSCHLGQELQKNRRTTFMKLVAIMVLAAAAALMIVNSFFRHLTPDISVYLLQTRTFLESLNRFTLSHDNKGLLLIWLLTPGVKLLGPTMAAAALTQLLANAAAAVVFLAVLRRRMEAPAAWLMVLLWLNLTYSSFFCGGRGRPEDFAAVIYLLAFMAALQPGRGWRCCGGALAAAAAFIKLTLVLAPAVLTAAALAADLGSQAFQRRPAREIAADIAGRVGWVLAGAVLAAIPILAWTAIMDDWSGWYHQTITLPMSRRTSGLTLQALGRPWELLRHMELLPLAGVTVVGTAIAGLRGLRREAIMVSAVFAAEWLRIVMEGGYWAYLLLPLLPFLLMSAGWVALPLRSPWRATAGWVLALLLVFPILADTYWQEIRAFQLRVIQRRPAPYEELARRMRPEYRQGETLLVAGNDLQLFLLLGAPPPPPLLPGHFWQSPRAEIEKVHAHYDRYPPDWLVIRYPGQSPVRCFVEGGVDDAWHVYLGSEKIRSSDRAAAGPGIVRPGRTICTLLPANQDYRLAMDIGYAQAWRRVCPDHFTGR